ncbi:MAG: cyclic nucleotide-binding protein [Alteromonadaceae bacterium]|nr:cyclic nucleotide-binding protein [Alteromonadaceae bacterium]
MRGGGRATLCGPSSGRRPDVETLSTRTSGLNKVFSLMVQTPRPGERVTLSVLSRQLRGYRPLDRLTEDQRILVAARGEQMHVPAGHILVDPERNEGRSYFLLRGALTTMNASGELVTVDAQDSHAVIDSAALQGPIRTLSDCQVLQIETGKLNRLLREAPGVRDGDELQVTASEDPLYAVLTTIHGHLQSNRLQLPSLPDVAWRVRRVADQENSTADDIARVINADPAMAAKLVKAGNSAVFRGFSETTVLRDVIVRLGLDTTRQLVTVFALRELFHTDKPLLLRAMDRLWEHTREVAALSWALARAIPGINPEEAMLAGLLHGIGAIPVIQYAERFPSLCADEVELAAAVEALQGEVGGAILRHWGFSESVCETAEQAGQWLFDTGSDEPRLVDVVLIAQMHALISQQKGGELPVFSDVPAFGRLGALTPEKSLRVLLAAREQIESVKLILSGQPELESE